MCHDKEAPGDNLTSGISIPPWVLWGDGVLNGLVEWEQNHHHHLFITLIQLYAPVAGRWLVLGPYKETSSRPLEDGVFLFRERRSLSRQLWGVCACVWACHGIPDADGRRGSTGVILHDPGCPLHWGNNRIELREREVFFPENTDVATDFDLFILGFVFDSINTE